MSGGTPVLEVYTDATVICVNGGLGIEEIACFSEEAAEQGAKAIATLVDVAIERGRTQEKLTHLQDSLHATNETTDGKGGRNGRTREEWAAFFAMLADFARPLGLRRAFEQMTDRGLFWFPVSGFFLNSQGGEDGMFPGLAALAKELPCEPLPGAETMEHLAGFIVEARKTAGLPDPGCPELWSELLARDYAELARVRADNSYLRERIVEGLDCASTNRFGEAAFILREALVHGDTAKAAREAETVTKLHADLKRVETERDEVAKKWREAVRGWRQTDAALEEQLDEAHRQTDGPVIGCACTGCERKREG